MTDKQQAGTGKVIKFGPKQLKNPTPNWVRYTFDIVLGIAGLWAFLSPMMTDIPDLLLGKIDHWVLVIMAASKFIIKYLGWDYKHRS